MPNRTDRILVLSLVTMVVGVALASDSRCRGACQQLARQIFGYGFRSFLRPFGI